MWRKRLLKKACGVAISADGAPKLTKRQKDAIPEHKHELTNNFMLALPKLMERFQADEAIMCELVEIPAHMDVSQYAAARKKKALTDLVKHLRVAYMKHSDSELLLHVAGKVCDKAAMFAWAKAKLRPAFGLREKEAYSNYGYIVPHDNGARFGKLVRVSFSDFTTSGACGYPIPTTMSCMGAAWNN